MVCIHLVAYPELVGLVVTYVYPVTRLVWLCILLDMVNLYFCFYDSGPYLKHPVSFADINDGHG